MHSSNPNQNSTRRNMRNALFDVLGAQDLTAQLRNARCASTGMFCKCSQVHCIYKGRGLCSAATDDVGRSSKRNTGKVVLQILVVFRTPGILEIVEHEHVPSERSPQDYFRFTHTFTLDFNHLRSTSVPFLCGNKPDFLFSGTANSNTKPTFFSNINTLPKTVCIC